MTAVLLATASVILSASTLARAAEAGSAAPAAPDDAAAAADAPSNPVESYFAHWFDRVNEAQASQPQWITPVVTVTPRLEEEVRYDFGFQGLGNGADVTNYGMGKGLELIPTTSNEVILNIPNYEVRSKVKPAEGFTDAPVLVVKQRFASENEAHGNYIVTGFVSVQAPTGVTAFTNDAWVLAGTVAGGKGFGPFDVQGTLGVSYPLDHESVIGALVATNVAFQYHLGKILWPEFEINYAHWIDGARGGKNQVFLTPGIVFGRFPLAGRVKAIVGLAYHVAVSPRLNLSPALTPTYDHQLILTTRLAF